jgi:hypothetical protein
VAPYIKEKEMSTVDYYYKLDTNTITTSDANYTLGSTSGSCTVSGCGCTGYHWYYPNYYHTCPPPVKLYQIFCPKPGCTGKFWAEIDEIKACPVCKKKIKITDKQSDYEVAVTK